MNCRWILVPVAIVACMSAGHSAAQRNGSPLISEIAAQRHGLTRAWFGQVDLDRSRDRIQSISLHDGMLVAQSKRGVIHAMDGETGKTLWVQRVGSSDHPTTAVSASDEHVAVINGSMLYMLMRNDGSILWKRRVVGAPGAGPALNAVHVFVPTISGVLEAYEIKKPRKPAWLYNSGGRALIQPFISEHSISWSTDRGLFYVAGSEGLNIRFRTESQDAIVAQPAFMPPYFYVAALDGYLYKVHERSGKIAWRFSAGEPVASRPVAVNGRIYMAAQHGGLYCVLADESVAREMAKRDRSAAAEEGNEAAEGDEEAADEPEDLPVAEGDQIWWSPRMVQLLAVTPSRVYGLDKTGRMLIVRADTGSPVDSMPTQNLSISLINSATDRIYLGTDTGLIQCLHEPELTEPLKYIMVEPIEESREEVKQQPVDEEDKKPAVEDPFGGGGGDDPFGGGGADDPFGGGAKDDPFGGGAKDDPFGGGGAPGAEDGDAGGGGAPDGGGDDPFGKDPFG